MGLNEWAAILQEAMKFFGSPYPRVRRIRQEVLEGFEHRGENPFESLDARFFEWLKGDYDRWSRIADDYAAAV